MKLINRELLKEKLESRMAEDIAACRVGGASLLVKQQGKVIYKNCFSTDFAEVNDDTIFRLASMTKPITAVAALICRDKGLFSISDPVKKYIPECHGLKIVDVEGDELKVIGTQEKDITITHLLSHTSGICCAEEGVISSRLMTEKDRKDVNSTVAHILKCGISFEPGTQQAYSGFGAFDVMVKVIETVTGEDFYKFIKKNIFEPCNMKNTAFEPTFEQWERIIPMHNRVHEKSVQGTTVDGCIFNDFPASHRLGGAGLISTLEDYSSFAEMLVRGGEFCGNRIISEESVRLMSTPQVPEKIMPADWNWGLGVRVITKPQTLPVGTFGWSGAYGTHFWVDPENEITAVYMKNSHYDGGAWNVTAVNFEKDVYNSAE